MPVDAFSIDCRPYKPGTWTEAELFDRRSNGSGRGERPTGSATTATTWKKGGISNPKHLSHEFVWGVGHVFI